MVNSAQMDEEIGQKVIDSKDASVKRIYCYMIYYKMFEEQLLLISSWYVVHLGS